MVGALVNSGRVIFVAGAVMVAGFLTFALSGPVPPKGMGIILGIAALLERLMLVPILLRPTGRAVRSLPRWLDRLLSEVRFGY